MKLAANALLLTLFLLTPACETLSDAGISAVNINEILAGITDQQSAESAKAPLDGAVSQLKAALAGAADDAKNTAEASADEATAEGTSMVNTVCAQFGIGPDTAGMISGLMDNAAVKGVLGETLTQLTGLLPAM